MEMIVHFLPQRGSHKEGLGMNVGSQKRLRKRGTFAIRVEF